MKVETNMGCSGGGMGAGPIRWRLAIALVLGMLANYAWVTNGLAQEAQAQSSDSPWTAALPDAGAPPAPATAPASESSASEPALPGEDTAAAPSDQASAATAAEAVEPPATTPEATAPEVTAPEATVPQATAPQAAAQADEEHTDSASGQSGLVRSELEVRELSVAPESKPLLPADRPAWVGAPPDLSNARRHRLFVGSFPTSSAEEVDAALDEPMLAAVNGYIDEQVLEGKGSGELHITPEFIRHNLLDRATEYLAELSTSTGPLYQKWVVLEITPEHREHFAETYRQVEQTKRMAALGLGLLGLMGLTGVAHVAFNRRRRRYVPTVMPVMHGLHEESDPAAAKHGRRALWLVAGCVGSVTVVASLVMGSWLVASKSRSDHSMTVHAEPEVFIHGEPPMAPSPPAPPDVSWEPTSMHSEQLSREALNRRNVRVSAEMQHGVIQLRSYRD